MPKFKLDDPLLISDLLMLALQHPDACYDAERHLPKEELVKIYTGKLEEKSDMLLDYFGIEISTGMKSSEPSESKASATISKTATPKIEEAQSPDKAKDTAESKQDHDLKLFTLPIVVRGIKPFP